MISYIQYFSTSYLEKMKKKVSGNFSAMLDGTVVLFFFFSFKKKKENYGNLIVTTKISIFLG